MNFVLRRTLRVLSVIEFVILLLDTFFIGDFELPSNLDFADKSALLLISLKVLWSSFGTSVYIATLVLLYSDVQVCNSQDADILIIIASVSLALRLALNAFFLLLTILPGREQSWKEVQALAAMGRRVDQGFSFISRLWANLAESRAWTKFANIAGIMLVLLAVAFGISFIACSVFFTITIIKLAIPGDFEASCIENSNISRVVLFALPGLHISLTLITMLFGLLTKLSGHKMTLGFVSVLLMLTPSLLIPVFSALLLWRLTKVWRGEEIEFYEYLALTVSYPLVAGDFSFGVKPWAAKEAEVATSDIETEK
eukprot:TRINITY_DN25928_c0_g1_i1.p1 TRINITY_DN25928_c0_g1~~TRINITY_DN25928_c0_g1_i1.p1  ORF type:complete len:312 (-),score=21.01 TRINITY_DN25928_c0_g1_i1:391-1326(-)